MAEVSVSPVDPYRFQATPDLFSNILVNTFNAQTGRQNADTSARAQDLAEYAQPQELALRGRAQGLAEQQFEFNKPLEVARTQAITSNANVAVRSQNLADQMQPLQAKIDQQRANSESSRVALETDQFGLLKQNNPANQARLNIDAAEKAAQTNAYIKAQLMQNDALQIAGRIPSLTAAGMQQEVAASQAGKAGQAQDLFNQSTQANLDAQADLQVKGVQGEFLKLKSNPTYQQDPRYAADILNSFDTLTPDQVEKNKPFFHSFSTEMLNNPTLQKNKDLTSKLLAIQTRTLPFMGGFGDVNKMLKTNMAALTGQATGANPSGVMDPATPPLDPALQMDLSNAGGVFEDLAKTPFSKQTDAAGQVTGYTFHFPKGDVPVSVNSPAFATASKMVYEGNKARLGGQADPLPPIPERVAARPGSPSDLPTPGRPPTLAQSNSVLDWASPALGDAGQVALNVAASPFAAVRDLWNRATTSQQGSMLHLQQNLQSNLPSAFASLGQNRPDSQIAGAMNDLVAKTVNPATPIDQWDASIDRMASVAAERQANDILSPQGAGALSAIPAITLENIKTHYGSDPADQRRGVIDALKGDARLKILQSMSVVDRLLYNTKKEASVQGLDELNTPSSFINSAFHYATRRGL